MNSIILSEEQNCWEAGCHGIRFYENGWTIPRVVPALIGPGALQKFPNAFVLQAYIKASMPFQWPGTLDDETAWKLTAFLMRENEIWEAREPLGPENAPRVIIAGSPAVSESNFSTLTPSTKTQPEPRSPFAIQEWGDWLLISILGLVFIFLVRLRRKI